MGRESLLALLQRREQQRLLLERNKIYKEPLIDRLIETKMFLHLRR
jgi:hypothetical protein